MANSRRPSVRSSAIEHQRAALRINPSNPTYREYLRNHLAGLAEVLVKHGDHARAAKATEEYARVSPASVQDPWQLPVPSFDFSSWPRSIPGSRRPTDRQIRDYADPPDRCLRMGLRPGR